MTIQFETTLKTYFETGDIPTETQFSDMIESCYGRADSVLPDPTGNAGKVLTATSSAPSWTTPSTGDGTPVGAIMYYAAATAPSGWLNCDGTAVSRSFYSNLFAVVSARFGAGDGSTTFNLPELRGEFIRCFDASRGIDSSRTFGSSQADELRSHTHKIINTASAQVTSLGGNSGVGSGGFGAGNSAVTNISITSAGGTETRPRNVALLACIKF